MPLHLIELTPARRGRLAEIFAHRPGGLSIGTKAIIVQRELGEQVTHREALSLLGQLRKRQPKKLSQLARKAYMDERFEEMKARRPDLYN